MLSIPTQALVNTPFAAAVAPSSRTLKSKRKSKYSLEDDLQQAAEYKSLITPRDKRGTSEEEAAVTKIMAANGFSLLSARGEREIIPPLILAAKSPVMTPSLSPVQLLSLPIGTRLERLPEIRDLGKLTIQHIQALLSKFHENAREGKMTEDLFAAVFEKYLSTAAQVKGIDLGILHGEMDKDDDGLITFDDFVDLLLGAEPMSSNLSVFKSEGMTLVSDDDSPLLFHLSKAMKTSLPPVTEISKLNLDHLQALLAKFMEADSDGEGLDMESFVECFREILYAMDEGTLQRMFMKIDANSDGSVSWEEFSQYVLEEGNVNEANSKKQSGGGLLEDPTDDISLIGHQGSICSVAYHHQCERYATIANDGRLSAVNIPIDSEKHVLPEVSTIRLWGSKRDPLLSFHHSARLEGVESIVLGTCILQNKHELRTRSWEYIMIVSSADGLLRFFDMDKLSLQGYMKTRRYLCTSMCAFNIKVVEGLRSGNRPLFAWGDAGGQLHIMSENLLATLLKSATAIMGSSSTPEVSYGPSLLVCSQIANAALTSIVYIEERDQIVVASSNSKIYILETRTSSASIATMVMKAEKRLQGEKYIINHEDLRVTMVFEEHSMEVKSVVWCFGNKTLASAGIHPSRVLSTSTCQTHSKTPHRKILVWDPFNGQVVGRLEGHKKGIQSLQYRYKDHRDVLISLDYRSTVKLWDPSNMNLLLSIDPTIQKGQIRTVGAILAQHDLDNLILFHRRPQVWPFQRGEDTGMLRKLGHKDQLVEALVNMQFFQLVLVDVKGLVTVWELEDGQQTFNFFVDAPATSLESQKPTAACFDNSLRRLMIGFSQGTVRLYNYSNGVLLNDLTNDSTGSILTVLATQEDFANKTLKPQDAKEQYLIASGWNCVVWIWPAVINKRGDVGYIQKLIPKGNIDSLEEIISMHFRNPNILFTGSKDGHFLVWNIATRSCRYDHVLRHVEEIGTVEISRHDVLADEKPSSQVATGAASLTLLRAGQLRGNPMIEMNALSPASSNLTRRTSTDVSTEGTAIKGSAITCILETRIKNLDGFVIVAVNDGSIRFLSGFQWNQCYVVDYNETERVCINCMTSFDSLPNLYIGRSNGVIEVLELTDVRKCMQHNIEAVEDITSSCKLVATWRAHSGGGVRRVRAIKRKEMHLLVSCGGEERGRAILWRIDGSKIGEIRSDYNSLPLWKQADLLAAPDASRLSSPQSRYLSSRESHAERISQSSRGSARPRKKSAFKKNAEEIHASSRIASSETFSNELGDSPTSSKVFDTPLLSQSSYDSEDEELVFNQASNEETPSADLLAPILKDYKERRRNPDSDPFRHLKTETLKVDPWISISKQRQLEKLEEIEKRHKKKTPEVEYSSKSSAARVQSGLTAMENSLLREQRRSIEVAPALHRRRSNFMRRPSKV